MDNIEKLDEVELSIASTACRQCIFSEYDGNTQVGCNAGRLELFSKNGVEIVRVEDDEKQFFVIKDKACHYFKHQDIYGDLVEETSLDEVKDRVRDSLRMPYQVMVFLRHGKDEENLTKRLDELEAQDVKPSIVTIIDRTHSSIDLSPKIVGLFHREYDFKDWRTQRFQSTDTSDLAAVDICYDNTKKLKYFFYTTFEVTEPIPPSFSRDIHNYVIEQMQSFIFLGPLDGHHGRTVLKAAHAKYGGNSFDVDLREKLHYYDDSIQLIKSVEEICPSLKTS